MASAKGPKLGSVQRQYNRRAEQLPLYSGLGLPYGSFRPNRGLNAPESLAASLHCPQATTYLCYSLK